MERSSTPSSTTSGIVDDRSDLPHSKRKDVMECRICWEPPTDPVAASCGHVFCWPCMYQWFRDGPKPCLCPVCRHSLRIDRDIIPLYGGGAVAGPSNDNDKGSAAESLPASDRAIPPRPSNPLLVTSTASVEGSTHVRPATDDSTGTDIDTIFMRLRSEHSAALVVQRRLRSEHSVALAVQRTRVRNRE